MSLFHVSQLALQKKPEEINRRSADMWSFAVLLWELVTREVPFADLSNMEIGMKVRECHHLQKCTLGLVYEFSECFVAKCAVNVEFVLSAINKVINEGSIVSIYS